MRPSELSRFLSRILSAVAFAKLDVRAAGASDVADAAFQVSGELSHLNEIRPLDHHKRDGELIRVPAATLTRILDEAGAPTHIDFMSIDTEGAELEVLKGPNLQRYCIDFICVEHNFVVEKRTAIRRVLDHAGYRCVSNAASLSDDWFVSGT